MRGGGYGEHTGYSEGADQIDFHLELRGRQLRLTRGYLCA
jgi:hypothetical protein